MKKNKYITLVLIAIILFILIPPGKAQEPPHPPTTGHGVQGNQNPGGTAPIGSGSVILLLMGVAYAGKKSFFQSDSDQ